MHPHSAGTPESCAQRVRNPQPAHPVKADVDHNVVVATIDLGWPTGPQQGNAASQTKTEAVQQARAQGENGATTRSVEVPTQPPAATGRATSFHNGGGVRVHRRYVGCSKLASFGMDGSCKREFFFDHKRDGMMNVVSKGCLHAGYSKRPSYGIAKGSSALTTRWTRW